MEKGNFNLGASQQGEDAVLQLLAVGKHGSFS